MIYYDGYVNKLSFMIVYILSRLMQNMVLIYVFCGDFS